MKPTSLSNIEHRIARHDHRPGGQQALPIIDYFYRPQTDAPAGRAQPQARDKSARRAFRRMMSTMMARQDKPTRLETIIYGLIVAIVIWPLIQLLIVLAQTANG